MTDRTHLHDITRRDFLKSTVNSATALVIGFHLPSKFGGSALAQSSTSSVSLVLNAWLHVTYKDEYIFILDRAEMGQGVMTALPMIMGEELDVDPKRFSVLQAPADRVYDNPDLGVQITGGSTSVHSAWGLLRQAGANARANFITAAAKVWSISESECSTDNGKVINKKTGVSFTYGHLAPTVLIASSNAQPKNAKDYKYIGKPHPRLENQSKVNGTAVFGIDVKIPNMKHAFVIRSLKFGATVKEFDASAAASHKQFIGVYKVSTGLAVVAETFYAAKQIASTITVTWNDPGFSIPDSEMIFSQCRSIVEQEGKSVKDHGDFPKLKESGLRTINAEYQLPLLAHATMEPQNCTANVTDNQCEVWAPTQSPALAKKAAIAASGLSEANVFINTTLLGGGFGRRLGQDYVTEAVEISKASKHPVKVIWSREQDIQHDIYRPFSFHKLSAVIDGKKLMGWQHHIVAPSILAQIIPDWIPALMPDWVPDFLKSTAGSLASSLHKGTVTDDTAIEGAVDLPYDIPNLSVQYSHYDPGVPLGFWRSVGHSYTAFVVESFIDEIAHYVEEDPYEFRKKLLTNSPRNLAVLNKVAQKSRWGTAPTKGVARGIAQHACFRSFAAAVAEVRTEQNTISVEKITLAIDCGRTINPDMIRAQLESAAIFGLSQALKSEITIKDGSVVQSNFHDFIVMRANEIPVIDIEIIESELDPTGVGEPGVPPIAPAVANAVFAATKQRHRKLPMV